MSRTGGNDIVVPGERSTDTGAQIVKRLALTRLGVNRSSDCGVWPNRERG